MMWGVALVCRAALLIIPLLLSHMHLLLLLMLSHLHLLLLLLLLSIISYGRLLRL